MNFTFQQKSPLIAKLESIATLTETERNAILAMPVHEAEIPAQQDIVHQGDRPTKSFYIRSGVTCAYKTSGAGKRQIVALHIAGDAPDLQSLHLEVLDIAIATLTKSIVVFMRHDDLRALCAQFPRLAGFLWRETLVDASIYREWLMSLGQRDGYNRVAHFLAEMVVRHQAIGLAQELEGRPTIPLAITQVQLGDTLGLSSVHINRSLQSLREAGLITWKGGVLTAVDWPGLQQVGDFDAAYLHLRTETSAPPYRDFS